MVKNIRTFEEYLQKLYIKKGNEYISKIRNEYRSLEEISQRYNWYRKTINDL